MNMGFAISTWIPLRMNDGWIHASANVPYSSCHSLPKHAGRVIAHRTASSTSLAIAVGLWAGGMPLEGSYTPVSTRMELQPAVLAPAMSELELENLEWCSV